MKVPVVILIISVFITVSSCKRTYMRVCDLPELILEPTGFTADEWDTVITSVYNTGFMPPVIKDTFIAENVDDVLLIDMGKEDVKDFEIFLPSVDKTYRLYDIKFRERTLTVAEEAEPDCYHDVLFTLDSVSYEHTGTGLVRVELHR